MTISENHSTCISFKLNNTAHITFERLIIAIINVIFYGDTKAEFLHYNYCVM